MLKKMDKRDKINLVLRLACGALALVTAILDSTRQDIIIAKAVESRLDKDKKDKDKKDKDKKDNEE